MASLRKNPNQMGFWEHLEEFRKTIVYMLGVVFAAFLSSLYFYQSIFAFTTTPLSEIQPTKHCLTRQTSKSEWITNTTKTDLYYEKNSNEVVVEHSSGVKKTQNEQFLIPPGEHLLLAKPTPAVSLSILGPLDGMTSTLKICFWFSLVSSSPIWLLFLLRFISPGLRLGEKRLIIPFFVLSLLMLSLGSLFALKLTIPVANAFLSSFNEGLANNFWSFTNYIDYTIILILSNALAFECFLCLFLLVHVGIITSEQMRKKRRLAIVLVFFLSGILTPPEVFTQCALALPILLMYELTIIYGTLRHRKISDPLAA